MISALPKMKDLNVIYNDKLDLIIKFLLWRGHVLASMLYLHWSLKDMGESG